MFSFFKKKDSKDTKEVKKASSPTIDNKKKLDPTNKPKSSKPKNSQEPRKSKKQASPQGKEEKPVEATTEASSEEEKGVLRQHIDNARETAKKGQFTGEIISAPFIMTNKNMNDGFRKIALMEEGDHKELNITKKQLVKLCWKEYARRFKVESYDFRRNKNIDNALKVVARDILLLTRESAKHIVFKDAEYNPNTGKVKLAFSNSRDLHSFIKQHTIDEGKELTDQQLNLLIAIEMFNTIYKTKRLNLPDFLTQYYSQRYNSIVLNINISKARGGNPDEIIASITSFDNKNERDDSLNEMVAQYKQSISSTTPVIDDSTLHQTSEDIARKAELNRKKEIFKKLGGHYNKLQAESEKNNKKPESIFDKRKEETKVEYPDFDETLSKQDKAEKQDDITDLPFVSNEEPKPVIEEKQTETVNADTEQKEEQKGESKPEGDDMDLPYLEGNEGKEPNEEENKNRITEEETLEDITPEGGLKNMMDDMDIPVFTDNPTINNLEKLRQSIKEKKENKES